MPTVELLQTLFEEGRLRLPASAVGVETFDAIGLERATAAWLAQRFAEQARGLAGPMLSWGREPLAAATGAIRLLWRAARLLSDREAAPEQTLAKLTMPSVPTDNPAVHFAVDLLLRFAPGVLMRARAVNPRDVLTSRLTQLLLDWPLSGVLAGVLVESHDGPTQPELLEFGDHSGLMLLYAERLTAQPRAKPLWIPPPGPAREWYDRVAELRRSSAARAAETVSEP